MSRLPRSDGGRSVVTASLVLSTPGAIASGLAVGARRGLLVKGGGALEAIGQVRTFAFDKTGTLTEGRPRVTDVLALSGSERTLLGLAAGSNRPVRAVSAPGRGARPKCGEAPRIYTARPDGPVCPRIRENVAWRPAR